MIITIAVAAASLAAVGSAPPSQRITPRLVSADLCPVLPSTKASGFVLKDSSVISAPGGEINVNCEYRYDRDVQTGPSNLPAGDYEFELRCSLGLRLSAPGYLVQSATFNYLTVIAILPVADSSGDHYFRAVVRVTDQLPQTLSLSLTAICL